ncbi:MAG TPA: hypothetical protein ENG62_01340 [Thermoplasmatales archaeon]|nr:hypothetical protein [Thermoplasmatales archaeon]
MPEVIEEYGKQLKNMQFLENVFPLISSFTLHPIPILQHPIFSCKMEHVITGYRYIGYINKKPSKESTWFTGGDSTITTRLKDTPLFLPLLIV